VTGVETLAIAADLPDEAELTTSAYIMYTQIMNQNNTDTSKYQNNSNVYWNRLLWPKYNLKYLTNFTAVMLLAGRVNTAPAIRNFFVETMG